MAPSWRSSLAIGAALLACGGQPPEPVAPMAAADVVGVEVAGEPMAYAFAVRVASADTGCEQYADWWEVVSLEGELVYRRVLAHSHVAEQPFARRGGPVRVGADTPVWVRAHMHPTGYAGRALKGSVSGGFEPASPPEGFAAGLAEQEPLPQGCGG